MYEIVCMESLNLVWKGKTVNIVIMSYREKDVGQEDVENRRTKEKRKKNKKESKRLKKWQMINPIKMVHLWE